MKARGLPMCESSQRIADQRTVNRRGPALGLMLSFILASAALADDTRVNVVSTPRGGIQPQAAVDAKGVVHLVFFRGDPAAGDVFYTRAEPGKETFGEPVRVDSQAGSALAIGTIRGPMMALGRGGRVHVIWSGASGAKPSNPLKGVPLLYTRATPEGTAFEPQRNLMTATYHLDGGGSVAADNEGHVYVGWHAASDSAPEGEKGRRFFVARSNDDGATFAPEAPALDRDTGACACCGTRALADGRGNVYFLYRAAHGGSDRDMTLLASRDAGEHFTARTLHPWRLFTCPMSSASLAVGPEGITAAWETNGEVYFSSLNATTLNPAPPTSPSPPGGGTRKLPSVAVNSRGETLLAWAEGTAWERGGTLAWRLYDASGRPTRQAGRLDKGIPVWGLPTAVARTDGSFLIIH